MKKYNYLFLVLLVLSSCEGFLDEKPDKSILVPKTVSEFEAVIDNYDRINYTPVLPFLLADDYWTTSSNFQSFTPWQQNAYLWSKDPYLPGDIPLDYALMYQKIFKANVLLDAVEAHTEWSKPDSDRLKGKAYFWRALAYFELAQLHLPIPDASNLEDVFELPLIISPNMDQEIEWAGTEEIFALIKSDLIQTLPLLPKLTELPTQPTYYAARGLMARVNMYRGEYELAEEDMEEVLTGPFELMDYSEFDMTCPYPFSAFNSETVLFTYMTPESRVSSPRVALVDSLLVFEYDSADLRSSLLEPVQNGEYSFKGNYTGNYEIFTGIALDEVYLTLAESKARLGKVEEGHTILNLLLEKRIKGYSPLAKLDRDSLLERIKSERRKSLVFRGQRWSDMKRWAFWDQQRFESTRIGHQGEVTFGGLPNDFQIQIPQRELDFR